MQNRIPVVFAATLTSHATQVQAMLANSAGQVVRRAHETSPVPLAPAEALACIARMQHQMLSASGDESHQVIGASFAVEGSFDAAQATVVVLPQMPTWDGFALRDALATALGTPHVCIDTLTNAALVGEMIAGAGQDAPTALYLDLSRAISAGLWWQGQVLHRPYLGTLGHIPVPEAVARCACGGRGHLETVASAQALVRWMIGALVEAPATEAAVMHLTDGRAEALTVVHIWQLACDGDEVATRLMGAAITALASVILTLLLTLDVERIILGGTLAQCGASWLTAVQHQIAAHAPPARAEALATRVVLSQLGPQAVWRGSIALAMDAATRSDAAHQ